MTKPDRPLVSVIIPAHNQARYLAESIESALAQAGPRVEVIVVDDGSTDDTPAIARRHPQVTLIRQPNAGVSAARNAGFAASRGDLVVFLDGDDRLMPGALEAGARELADAPAAAFAAGRYRHIDADGIPGEVHGWRDSGGSIYERLVQWNIIGMLGTVMFRRDALPPEPFERTLRSAEDWDLYLRIVRDRPVRLHDAMVAEYRRYGDSKSANPARMLGATMAVLERQRDWVSAHQELAAAHREGIAGHGRWYGGTATDDLLYRLRRRALWPTVPAIAAMLLRHYRVGALRRIAQRVAEFVRVRLRRQAAR